MQEIRFTEQFEKGEIAVHLSGPLSTQTYDALSSAMEHIRGQLVALIAPQGAMGIGSAAALILKPQGRALDPSALTDKIPGINPADRRRGPRAAKKLARRK